MDCVFWRELALPRLADKKEWSVCVERGAYSTRLRWRGETVFWDTDEPALVFCNLQPRHSAKHEISDISVHVSRIK